MSKFRVGDKVTWKETGDKVWVVSWCTDDITIVRLDGEDGNVALNASTKTFTLVTRDPVVGDVYLNRLTRERVRVITASNKRVLYVLEKDLLDRTKQDFILHFEHEYNG